MSSTVLLIEDSLQSIDLFKSFLEGNDYRVVVAQTGDKALSTIDKQQVDVIIVDLMLPDIFGADLCAEIRKKCTTPILVLSASEEDEHYVQALDLGADSIVNKNTDLKMILAKINALSRRNKLKKGVIDLLATPEEIRFSGWCAFPAELYAISPEPAKVTVQLTSNEARILTLLAQNPQQTFTRESINELLALNADDVFCRSVDTIICRLRKKFNRITPGIEVIQTVRNKGYQFIADANEPVG